MNELLIQTLQETRDGIEQVSTAELLADATKLIEKTKAFLISKGEVIEFDKYLTIKRYCEKYNIKDESVVTNWIRRGLVPSADVRVIQELNGLRMIRDRSYKNV